ncbi:aspartyl-phosphate phosphatase Spo0E family protein [Paenibacillus sp. Leaf72]|uniref:aspartyl-phosphate phosphatase Spo0E family protein n=1 Tax=Paenibacillus sp. Leaf72 TaxID=1736234 RepID=UPI0006F920A1|nr:aspartyl-phosphate phosphatase Spo0E family protein [Paenibacillus sp. Leaf72]KQN96838.1 hypothetical protein ASF12_22465 [Paenibacillus sp. Leaf72]
MSNTSEDELKELIAIKREEMHKIASSHQFNFNIDEVLEKSVELDKLLNEFSQLTNKPKENVSS